MATVISGDFEWDDAKAAANLAKHGVAFEEAVTAFDDPHALDMPATASGLVRGTCRAWRSRALDPRPQGIPSAEENL